MSQVDTTPSSTMKRSKWKTALWVLFVVVIVVVVFVALFMRASVRRAFPQTEGTIQIDGLSSDVEVIRDSMGVPHIYADSVDDLFLAQGYVHAQDRFYQMDFWRHISYGRLSEMFGSSQSDTDQFLRTMGWGDLAEDQYHQESADVQQILDQYADGVNAYLATESPSDLSFEYTVLEVLNHNYTPEAWTPAQSLAWGKVMSWDLGGNLGNEIGRAMALGTLPPDRVQQLYPPYPGDRHPYIIPTPAEEALAEEAALMLPPDALRELAGASTGVRALANLTGGPGDGIGSNSWAVSGEHTPTGSPMLMNDPHLSIQMPSIWYQVGLHCRAVTPECPYDVAGFSFAGVPGVIIGHNADIAWGFTNTGPDVQDLYVEKINPDNPLQYEYKGEWLDMEVTEDVIRVAGGDDIPLEIRSTIHGPIISDVYEPLEDFDQSGSEKPSPYALTLRWTALDEVPSIASPILGINSASNFDEFREAALLFSVPAQNLLYADTEGNIGYQMPGNIPIRSQGDGTVPVPGWTGEYEWTGFVPYDELPFSYNPNSGYIVTANNA
ncbi:MAG: penicillin acylase family protein, partial [Acidimicrobiia bacterium]